MAVFTTLTRSKAAEVVDLSCTGARLRGDFLPDDCEELLVSIGRIRAFGRVAWLRGRECGVAFETALSPHDVDEFASVLAQRRGLSLEMQRALDDWSVGSVP
jgi:hypothetical protein